MSKFSPLTSSPAIAEIDAAMVHYFQEKFGAHKRPENPGEITAAMLSDGRAHAFAASAPATCLLRSGWSQPETTHTWNDGSAAVMDLPLFSTTPTVFHFILAPFLPPGRAHQEVRLSLSGRLVALWHVHSPGTFSTVVPPPIGTPCRAELTWHFPMAVSPAEVGSSADTRRLAVALNSIRLQVF